MKSAALLDAMSGSGAEWWAAHYAAVADIEAGRDAIALTVGQVDLPAPACLLAKASDQVLAGRREYSAACGENPVREAIARKFACRSGRAIGREHVIFAPGAQGCLALVSQCLADPGDDILIPEPRYITYGGISAAARLNIVPVPLRPEKNFHLDPDDLERAISPRSKILILNSPHNPTGATLSAAELAAIGEVAAAHGLWILSDEVYEDFIFRGRFASPFDDPALADRTISVGSLSKSHAVPGWRCGWAVGPPGPHGASNTSFRDRHFQHAAPPAGRDGLCAIAGFSGVPSRSADGCGAGEEPVRIPFTGARRQVPATGRRHLPLSRHPRDPPLERRIRAPPL